ncbi:hypothetical protein JL722_5260 [Aureococcus anophagefferens]|nr:hypothetical protein JL722_5260 [Aureococcus anophagefferens]
MAESALEAERQGGAALLDLVDELRSLGIEQDLPLPQIAVMGDQSSGKSSVLEALSGVPFPRGTGLGSTSGFSTDSIVVTVNAPSVPDLTIIDLPGIVRTATQGQDPRVIGPPVWKTVDRNLLGVANLTAKLTKLLTKRIASVLPELKWELQEHFEETEKETEKLGDPPPAGGMERAKLVLRLFADYSSVLRHSARGDYREQILSQNPRLRLRAVADRVFRQLEQEISEQKPDFEAHDFTMKLHQELKALRGRELPGLLNSYFFYGFMARHAEIGVAVSTSPVFHA